MSAKEFIIFHLKEFLKEFKHARVRYEHDALTQTHTIEVFPQSLYDSQNFLDWECDFFDQFSIDFPGDVIGFISEDALVGIEKVDFESEGIFYSAFTTNPSTLFNAPISNIEVSNTKYRGAVFSVSDLSMKDSFKETFVNIDDIPDNYQLAA